MTKIVAAGLEGWRVRAAAGEPIDVGPEMMRFTLLIIMKLMFSIEPSAAELHETEEAFRAALKYVSLLMGTYAVPRRWQQRLFPSRAFRKALVSSMVSPSEPSRRIATMLPQLSGNTIGQGEEKRDRSSHAHPDAVYVLHVASYRRQIATESRQITPAGLVFSPYVPGDDDLDDLIDSYVADAMRATGIRSDARAKPAPEPAPPPATVVPPPALPRVVTPRTKTPTPTGVAVLAAELFGDVADEVTPPPVSIDRAPLAPPPPPPPPPPVGPSITFTRPSEPRTSPPPAPPDPQLWSAQPASHVGPPLLDAASIATPFDQAPQLDLYVMPPLPGLSEAPDSGVPETLPGIGPHVLSPPRETFSADLPTDPDAEPAMAEPDDEPTNIVTRFPT